MEENNRSRMIVCLAAMFSCCSCCCSCSCFTRPHPTRQHQLIIITEEPIVFAYRNSQLSTIKPYYLQCEDEQQITTIFVSLHRIAVQLHGDAVLCLCFEIRDRIGSAEERGQMANGERINEWQKRAEFSCWVHCKTVVSEQGKAGMEYGSASAPFLVYYSPTWRSTSL